MLRQAFFFALVLGLSASASYGQSLQVSTKDGGSVVTSISEDIKVNKGSSLRRTWIALNDPACPLQLIGAGIETQYRGTSGYRFYGVGSAKPLNPMQALEIRYILYDTFGDHIKTLSQTLVVDIKATSAFNLEEENEWYASENDVSELLTVVAFVAQVRTSDGKIWRYDEKAVNSELGKIEVKVATGVLEPTKDKK